VATTSLYATPPRGARLAFGKLAHRSGFRFSAEAKQFASSP
jgi:hypothetical protein